MGQFPQKSSFSAIGQGQNYATVCLKQLCLIICFLRILKCSSVMRFNISSIVMFVSLPKKFLPSKGNWSNLGQNYPTLCFMIHSLRIVLEFYGIMRHNTYIDKSNVSQFFKIISFLSNTGPIWSKITQFILAALKIFRNILAWWDATVRH